MSVSQLYNAPNYQPPPNIPIGFPTIEHACFAIKHSEPVYEISIREHIVRRGENLSAIARENEVAVGEIRTKTEDGRNIEIDNPNSIDAGQTLLIPAQREIGKRVRFEYIDEGFIGQEVYIVVETKNFEDGQKIIKINVKQGLTQVIAAIGSDIEVNHESNVVTLIETNIGNFPTDPNIINNNEFTDWAIAKIKLQPSDANIQSWKDAIEATNDEKANLYLRVDAHSGNNEYDEDRILYYGTNVDSDNTRTNTPKNQWLDIDGKWFALTLSCCEGIELAQLQAIFSTANANVLNEMLQVFNECYDKFFVDTCLRKAHFFGQVLTEVGASIRARTEGLNYSADRLFRVRETRAADGTRLRRGPFRYFRNNPESYIYGRTATQRADQQAIANRAYANRPGSGNGDVASGDGWRYRGKGFIQLTFRGNYERAQQEINRRYPGSRVDILANPNDILTVRGGLISAMAFWSMNNLYTRADNGATDAVVNSITDIINRGTDSRQTRINNFNTVSGENIFNVNECINA